MTAHGIAPVRGRFAPSPTGRLHLGSLCTAVASWLDARRAGGEWYLRIEDVDRAREVPGAADDIVRTLEAFGLEWDGGIVRQSARGALYESALERLRARGRVYPCSCTRGEIGTAPPGEDPRYAGTCRTGPRHPERALALRVLLDDEPEPVTAEDRLQGALEQHVARTTGDFVLRRRDGFWAYQLAVVVDDAAQEITDVVRGVDLWDHTPRQIVLQRLLGLPTPRYLHLPLVVEADGGKLSKSARAVPADPAKAPATLSCALRLLRHPVPDALRNAPVREQLAWAVGAWDEQRLRGVRDLRLPACGD